MKIDFKCEIKIASRWQHVTVNKWVVATEPNHLKDWIIQEWITETQNSAVTQQKRMQKKQAIWCLKCKSVNINVLFTELLNKINIKFVIMLIFEEETAPLFYDFNWNVNIYIFCPHILNFAIILNAL